MQNMTMVHIHLKTSVLTVKKVNKTKRYKVICTLVRILNRKRDNNATGEVNHSFLFILKAVFILTTSITSVLIKTTVPLKLAPAFATGELGCKSIDILGKLPTPTLITYGVWTGDLAELLVPQY